MNSKKAITLLILATMMMALVPTISVKAVDATGLSDNSGQYGDTITVFGDGLVSGFDVSVYWDNAGKETFTSGSGKLNTTEAEPDGTFEINFDVPVGVAGPHYIWVKDSEGNVDSQPLQFTVLPKLETDPSSGLGGDEVSLMGYGFGEEVDIDEVNITDDFGETVNYGSTETDEYGSWSLSFDVPEVDYQDYTITAMDTEGNTANAEFTVGASITLSKDIGPVGTYLRVEGRGFTEDATIDIGDIVIGEAPTWFTCWIDNDDDPVEVNSQGKFRADIVIPSAPDGEWEIMVTENSVNAYSADADFEIEEEGQAEIEVSPEYGPVGSRVTVMGYNFSQLNGLDVVIYVDGTEVETFETDSDGTFEGTFRLPGATGTAVVMAEQADQFIEADTNFRVGSISVILTPDEGPAGTRITLSGAGFSEPDGEEWSATFGGEEWIEETDIPLNGVITKNDLWVPSMEPGVYEVVVTEVETDIQVTAEFTITENTYVELSPMVAPNEYNVTIMGYNFAELPEDPDLDFLLYNETDEWDLDVFYEGSVVELEADPDWEDDYDMVYFEGWFLVPEDEEIGIGDYMINVTDGEGMMAHIEFSVVEETQSISPRKQVFAISDTVSFNIELSFAEVDSYIEIYDPDGDLFWTTDPFVDEEWVQVGTIERVPYYEQTAGGNPMLLLSDAPLGEYTWEYYQDDDDLIDEGVFTVESAPEDVIAGQIEDLNNQLDDLSSQVDGVSSEIANMQSDIDAANQAANSAREAAEAANDAINNVADQASQAQQAAERAADAAEQAQEATQGLTTLVYGAIGAALVAALAAIVSLMQISQKIAG
ncbi:hypothetical protein GF319_14755 [Candidatus Bathyarchaeota archaeon]|nr:hypothetical protein [Candidatus Bathyarchaeota archaeon]